MMSNCVEKLAGQIPERETWADNLRGSMRIIRKWAELRPQTRVRISWGPHLQDFSRAGFVPLIDAALIAWPEAEEMNI